MDSRITAAASRTHVLPEISAVIEKKKEHFQNIFGRHWMRVFEKSPVLDESEKILLAEDGGHIAGWAHFTEKTYSVRFRNFFVQPEFRGKGVASFLMARLAEIGALHHNRLLKTGKKSADILLMFLDSLIYPAEDGEGEEFAFGKFLKKMGFTPHPFNKGAVSEEERAAVDCYDLVRPGLSAALRIFRKKIVDEGIVLKDSTREELLRLSPDEYRLVLDGLDRKLAHYADSGRISYRYDICSICAHVGSSELDSTNCRKCMIRNMCFEPFRTDGRFKEDYQVSAAYFEEVRTFLRGNEPRTKT
ncbi:MAG: hypothetical protein A2934_03860 [Candidatus Sungbacteria bacterium RIFCSPLOWO2_01_FULL_47_10]|uniref:N-acetyltransferase domain-containing protein n=1 Tax=Candidatus Sungbacteria bacterium RIFCSPLOWO2_01_FULL_47_10 TaxID=1802276 RepID=A0A1G2L568_9BACT|nr:MAG: hypothetical protein A2934_03860 [Candidatus Sungbacteria bacterium RIFCSPLOWO2_01_FULL_47_10]